MGDKIAGRVGRLYVTKGRTYIRLKLPESQPQPRDGYFALEQNHVNYNAIYSLVLATAINGYVLRIDTADDIKPDEYAEVDYIFVDW